MTDDTPAPTAQPATQQPAPHGAVNATGDETVRCLQCQRPTDWRDRLYVPSASGLLCKACQRWQERRTLRGYPIPASALPKPPIHHGAPTPARLPPERSALARPAPAATVDGGAGQARHEERETARSRIADRIAQR